MNETFESLMTRLTPTLRRIAHKANGHFSFFNDDDLYQEAVIHLWSAYEHGIIGDKTDSYILQGCYYHLKNYLRTTLDKAHHISIHDELGASGECLADVLADARQPIMDDLSLDELMGIGREMGLTDRELAVVRLSDEDLTVRQIGQRLGISHVMVLKIRASMIRKCRALKDELEN